MPESKQEIEGLDLLTVGVMLAERIRLLVLGPIIGAVLAVILSFLFPNVYLGSVRFMPPQEQSSIAQQLMSQLGAIGGLVGVGAANPSTAYVGMLQGREITDRIINRFKLIERYEKSTLYDTRLSLAAKVSIKLEDTGLILVDVKDKDPIVAAQMANAYVEELSAMMKNMAISQAEKKKAFFGQRLKEAKELLVSAENELKKIQGRTGAVLPELQGQATIEAAAMVRAQIAAKEVELASLRGFATTKNPDYQRALEQLNALRAEQRKLESTSGFQKGDMLIATGNLPENVLEYARKLRDVKYYETLTTLLAQQYEISRIDEARDFVVVNVVDAAVPADRQYMPVRLIVFVISFVLFFLLMLAASLALGIRGKLMSDPVSGEKLREIEARLRIAKIGSFFSSISERIVSIFKRKNGV